MNGPRFSNRVCLVTGGASGIGAGIALRFVREGARVIVIDQEEAPETMARIEAVGGKAESFRVDVSDAVQLRQTIQVLASRGRLDVLVNAAGISRIDDTRIVDISEETWDAVIAINLRGPFLMCKYALPILIEQGGGVIINISSQAGFGGGTAYAAAKAALNSLTRGIARQHAGDGIRCVTIAPGAVQTPMLEISKKKLGEGIVAPRPGIVKPVGTVEEVAALAAFLASDEAAYISGSLYTIDGGASGY